MLVTSNKEGIRLDIYLAEELDMSRSKIQKLLKDNKILVNNKNVNSSYLVKENDEIEVLDDELEYIPKVEAENIPLDIIYEDDDLIIINKKSGMVVHPAPGHYTGTLVNALLYHYGQLTNNMERPGIVHRLDKDTSGLMLVAKNDEILDKLSSMISKKEVERKYLAIVRGTFPNDSGTVDAPIGRDQNNRQKMAVTDVNSKDAITHFKVLERFNDATLLECSLETGRTHQIRVHMAYINHPVLNDPLYTNKKTTSFGQMLHSYKIKFNHPRTNKLLEYEVDPPKEFLDELEKLRQE